MNVFNIRSTLVNRDAILSTVWSILQQLVVAASTYFILAAIRLTTAGDHRLGILHIVAFVVCLILVYLPNTISMMYLQQWRLSSIAKFVEVFVDRNCGRTTFGHSRNKMKYESWLTNESFTVYDNATNLLYQILSTLMNSVFNIFVIAIALDTRILGWYITAGFVLMAANKFFKPRISYASLRTQETRKELANTMLTAWENIFVGNQYNFEKWQARFDRQLQQSKGAAAHYDLVRSVISSGTVTVALLIVALGNGIFLSENRDNVPAIAALLITLPRQLQIIQSIFAFFNLTLSWTGVAEQLRELESVILLGKDANESSDFVRFDSIEFVNGSKVSFQSTMASTVETLKATESDRWTIRGRNGVGKSTLLSLLKEELGVHAFFLPSQYADLQFGQEFLSHSDGNRLLAVFEEIAGLSDVRYILLDEWDANLDGENLETVNRAIDQLATSKVVIESRHRR